MRDPYLSEVGVVTFLDVLGWKGIWQRKNNAIDDLEDLVKAIKKKSLRFERGISNKQTNIMIVSDTIVIFTSTEKSSIQKVIDLHGQICKYAIPLSIKRGIPLRGATSFGDVVISSDNNIFAGKAIDEAASWHEMSDWIGVFLTPSASFIYLDINQNYWVKYEPPLKKGLVIDTYCVNWLDVSEDKINEIKNDFIQLAPIVPDIVSKFSNAIKFLEYLLHHR
ncbi:MAG: hypothetical protein P9X26_08415 [Candidatus Stygibacter frigidus]|nr:hypothetical protein [Candidatus Stygibacter frigidus]